MPSRSQASIVVFVGGIHGVGKTTLSKRLALALSASHVTAGGLIRETADSEHRVGMGVGGKAVPDVDANQELLLRGLDLFKARIRSGAILVDGHFSLLDSTGEIVRIPTTVYDVIAPVAIVLVETNDRVVYERLAKRDGAAPSIETISHLAESERVHARAVSEHLKIPIYVTRGDTDVESAVENAAANLRAILSW